MFPMMWRGGCGVFNELNIRSDAAWFCDNGNRALGLESAPICAKAECRLAAARSVSKEAKDFFMGLIKSVVRLVERVGKMFQTKPVDRFLCLGTISCLNPRQPKDNQIYLAGTENSKSVRPYSTYTIRRIDGPRPFLLGSPSHHLNPTDPTRSHSSVLTGS